MGLKEIIALNVVAVAVLIGCAELFNVGHDAALRQVASEQRAIFGGKVVGFPATGDEVQPMIERGVDVLQFFPGKYHVTDVIDLTGRPAISFQGSPFGGSVFTRLEVMDNDDGVSVVKIGQTAQP
jgi:hypothetical protein